MEIFQNEFGSTPVLVCLTHADRLYENNCTSDMIPECPKKKIDLVEMQFKDELQVIVVKIVNLLLIYKQKIIGPTTTVTRKRTVKFCSLTQMKYSPFNNAKGRESMRKVGIYTPEDIGDWIKHSLANDIQQKDLADKLESFLAKKPAK